MVKGLDIFAKAFADFSDCYIVIGGTACDLVLSKTEMHPRATDDIDILLVVEKLTPEFGKAFWNFIKAGGYKRGSRKAEDGQAPKYVLYSFDTPETSGYPVQIELLSHHSDLLGEPSDYYLEPIPFDGGVSSLSAIILSDDLYTITTTDSEMMDGVRVATSIALICLKIKAYRNLIGDKESGKHVNTKDIKKHRNDVLKLIATTSLSEPKIVSEAIMDDINWYVANINAMLPSQSLEGSLERNSEQIQIYLEVLQSLFSKD